MRAGKGSVSANPSRDWLVLLALTLLAIVISSVWNIMFFSDVLSGKMTTPLGEEIATDTSNVEKVDRLFGERAEEASRYRNEYRFVDPSR